MVLAPPGQSPGCESQSFRRRPIASAMLPATIGGSATVASTLTGGLSECKVSLAPAILSLRGARLASKNVRLPRSRFEPNGLGCQTRPTSPV